MSQHFESPLSVVIKGMVAGLAGTVALTAAMQRGPQIMEEKFGVTLQPDDPPPSDAPSDPTAALAERVATGVLETDINETTAQTAGQAIHWGYGALWGAVFGIVQSSFRLPLLLHGTIFGVVVAAVASSVVPAMGLAPHPAQQPKRMSAMQLVNHLIYGWVVALVFGILSRRRG